MAKQIGGTLYLNKEESVEFMRNMLYPNEEAMRRRDAFFKEIDKLDIQHLPDGSVVIDCPDITINDDILSLLK